VNGPITGADAASGASATRPPGAAARWWGLALLTAIYAVNQIDRFSVIVILEPIKHEFALNDGQLGVLTGLGYALVYAMFAIPVGALADRVNRRNLLAGLLMIWGLMTVVCGLARNFGMLLAARMLVGAAEAGTSPVSSSIISDLFPPQRRATAVAVYFLGTPIGSIISLLIGSVVASAMGWRATFLLAGAPALILAPLLLVIMREPRRGAADHPAPEDQPRAKGSVRAGLGELFRNPVLLCVVAGGALCTLVSSAFQAWTVSLLIREHGMSLKLAGATAAACIGLCSAVGAIVSGPLADRYAKGDSRRLLLFTAAVMLGAFVSELVAARGASIGVVIVGLVGVGLFSLASLGPIFSVVLNTSSPANRGLMIAAQQVAVTLIGGGGGSLGGRHAERHLRRAPCDLQRPDHRGAGHDRRRRAQPGGQPLSEPVTDDQPLSHSPARQETVLAIAETSSARGGASPAIHAISRPSTTITAASSTMRLGQ
jgi:predicted MFS family arabinose efflux permease